MISKSAIKHFLDRKLDSFYGLKKLSQRQLRKEIRTYAADFQFVTDPRIHQLVCFLIGTSIPDFLFLLRMGAGKSKVALDILAYRRYKGDVKRCLVVVPSESNIETWARESKKHQPSMSVAKLLGSSEKRWETFAESTEDQVVVSYPGLMHLLSGKVNKSRGGKKKLVADPDLVDAFAEEFQMVIFDEIHNLKNDEALVSIICEQLAEQIPFRIGLTGSPMAKPEDLFSQFHIIDRGATFGDNKQLFLESFYHKVAGPFGSSWEFDTRLLRTLHRMMHHRSIRYVEAELADLPPLIQTDISCVMSGAQLDAYKDALKKRIRAEEDGEADIIENTYAKLRQISSGFVSLKKADPTTGELIETTLPFATNAKMEALTELLAEIPEDSKVIIFHVFTESSNLIIQHLQKLKLSFVTLNGRTRDPAKAVASFSDDKDVKILVAQVKPGSTGHNFQMSNYTIFYEIPESPIIWDQAVKRTHRDGQQNRCYIYYLLPRGSIDNRVKDNVLSGVDLSEKILSGKVNSKELFTPTEEI